MKHFCLILALILLLCGCAASQAAPELPETAPAAETEAETQAPSTQVTLPPDPVPGLLKAMTTEEKVGQLFLARCPDENALEDIEAYHLGGYILFWKDFDGQTADTLKETLSGYQNAAAIPLLIAVDEEGGTVNRVSLNHSLRHRPFSSPRKLYSQGGMDYVIAAEEEKAQLLGSLGINVNMAPVCDITTDRNAFMYDRSLGESPEVTGQFVKRTVQTMSENHVGSVLKHFPGYGNNTDTHTGIAVDERPLEELEACDLVPFTVGIVNGCDAILMSHTIVTAFDSEYPVSLSPAAHEYLRQMQGFDGVIVTDDLVMQAITDTYGAEEAAVLAVLAGNDLLCSTEYRVQYQAVLEAVNSGRIPATLLDEAVERILRWKMELGLIF